MSTVDANLAGTTEPKAKVFISYSRRDLEFADRINAALKAHGFDTLVDRSDIYALEDWWRRIESLIVQADTIVFILSPDAVASYVCQSEVRFAASLNKRLAPIVCRPVEENAAPPELARLQFITFDDPAQFDANLDNLVEALETDIEWVRKHTEFGGHARRWMIAGRPGPRGLLLRPPSLDEAERWIASRPRGAPMPTEAVQAFIATSRRTHTRRRNFFTASLTAGLVLALALAGLAYWQREVAVEQRRLAETQRGIAVKQQNAAERNYAAATHAVDGLITDLAQGFKDQEGISLPAISQILERADDVLVELIEFSPNDPRLVKLRLTNLILTQDTFLDRGGDTDPAERAVNIAKDYLKDLLASDPTNVEFQKFLAHTQRSSGRIHVLEGQQTAALNDFQAALSFTKSLLVENPENLQTNRDCALLYVDVGTVLQSQGHLTEALGQFQIALTLLGQLMRSPQNKDNVDLTDQVSLIWGSIGDALIEKHDLAGALYAYNNDLKLIDDNRYSTNTREEDHLSRLFENMGDALLAQDNLPDAYSKYDSAIPILQRLITVDPKNEQWPSELGVLNRKLGDVLLKEHRLSEALEYYHSAVDIVSPLASKNILDTDRQRELAIDHQQLGATFLAQNSYDAALNEYKMALELTEKLAAIDPDSDVLRQNLDFLRGSIKNIRSKK